MTPRDRANREQRAASDPAVSAFVAASAGSGKTKLLTDRLLRLMLAGKKLERIQCLTFTKAAAAEMAVRLQRTLGKWVTLDDAPLDRALTDLAIDPTPDLRRRARALFAHVLDLPGGMRIGTIHAFCQSLLRRFPLEAALSPHFQLVDERDAADALTEARETMLANASTDEARAALQALAGLASADQFGRHVEALQADRQRLATALTLPDLPAAQRRALNIAGTAEADIIAAGVNWQAERDLREAARIVHQLGARTSAERSGRILEWLGLDTGTRVENWPQWCTEFLTTAGVARAASVFASKAVTDRHPDIAQVFLAEAQRIIGLIDDCRALAMADLSAALLVLAAPVLRAYATHKQDSGLVDYDDLIGRTSQLLVNPGAAWVLYKLDGGLDHLLLDEVQDTAPAQWRIAHALTAEFFAGAGAREENRTVFAVGDRKQSIYSFQGADADEFDRSRDLLERRVTAAGGQFLKTPLDVSFRSTQPVLSLVDAVFDDPVAAAGVVEPGDTLKHHADRADHAGAVELWPLTPVPDETEPEPWEVAEANQNQHSAPQRLADTLAEWIRGQTSGGVMLESRGRPLAPGDVLVLVRRRNAFARALVRALKTRGVPVAGLDRLELTEQSAVQDLMALADALLLPQDDLNFACLLTSPLGGLDDDDLLALAVNRPGTLFEALRARARERPHWQRAWDFFAALLARADYVSPYALFAEALGPLGGRARLFARLGPEAAEPVDELLNAALAYARLHPPSLQGFLHWLRRSGAEVKREAQAAGNQVRVMTVHGAKGLQAPLVILPDTTAIPPDDGSIVWAEDPLTRISVPLFSPRKEFRCVAVQRVRDDLTRRRLEEHNRLLYVALTRAEDRLVVCGWQTRRGLPDVCWYNLVARGFDRLAPDRSTFEPWDGDLLQVSAPQRAMPDAQQSRPDAQHPRPDAPQWRPDAQRPRPAAPQSRLEEQGSRPPDQSPGLQPSRHAGQSRQPQPPRDPERARDPRESGDLTRPGPRIRGDDEQDRHGALAGDDGSARADELARDGGAVPKLAMPAWTGSAPDWRSSPPPPETGRPQALAPSRPEGVELGTVPAAASPLAERSASGDRFRRGQLLHALLQHLPDLPEAEREAAAAGWLARPGQGLPGDSAATLAAEAMAILAHPDLAPVFAPGSMAEVPLTGLVGGPALMDSVGSPPTAGPQAAGPQAGGPQARAPEVAGAQAGYPQAGDPQAGGPHAGNPQAGGPPAGGPEVAGFQAGGFQMPGAQVVGGLVDRLAVLPDRVLVVDFKTNRLAPEHPEDTPVMYLRQMAAYRAVLRGIFPDRTVQCALVWTRAARVAMLPDTLLDAHAPGASAPGVSPSAIPAKAGTQTGAAPSVA